MKKDKEDPFVCGHVVCKTCVDAIVRPQGRCCVCEAKLEEGEKGLIPLGKEGALRCETGSVVSVPCCGSARVVMVRVS